MLSAVFSDFVVFMGIYLLYARTAPHCNDLTILISAFKCREKCMPVDIVFVAG